MAAILTEKERKIFEDLHEKHPVLEGSGHKGDRLRLRQVFEKKAAFADAVYRRRPEKSCQRIAGAYQETVSEDG